MKRAALAFAALATGGCLFVLNKAQPDSEPIARDPARVERGRYVVEAVANCFACHPGAKELGDDHRFGRELGLAGEVWAPNLSPDPETGLGNWTDGLVGRAIREGVDNDHEALVPVMPYRDYAAMSDEDVKAVVAYLRSRPPVRLAVPDRKLDFPFSLLVNLIPAPVKGPVAAPDRRDKVAYGKYLATLASCATCHTPRGHQGPRTELLYAGGTAFPDPEGEVVSPNITSDLETGIGAWDDQAIRDAITKGLEPGAHRMRGPMPWRGYAGMTGDDVGALVAYVRTIAPIRHQPRKTRPPGGE